MSDDFDANNTAYWDEVDAITAQAMGTVQTQGSDPFDQYDSFIFDDAGLRELDRIEAAAASVPVLSTAKTATTTHLHMQPRILTSYKPQSTSSSKPLSRQTTLLGGLAPKPKLTPVTQSQPRSPGKRKPNKVKVWPYDSFIGWRIDKGKRKKSRQQEDSEGEEIANISLEQFPEPACNVRRQESMKLTVDRLAAVNWLFPIGKGMQKRDYQFNIIKNCLFENSLVALPTGLGKTFIAATIMLNYHRWFPQGKLIFVAPTKPLVNQQIEACHNVCGIPQDEFAVMMGGVPRDKRTFYWVHKRVYFMTPQTLMIELMREACDPSDVVLLVIDEAHRGTGNYAYAQVVRYLMHTNPFIRILGLTATPANRSEKVQEIVDSLHLSHIEMRNEDSLDIRSYIHKKEIKRYVVKPSKEMVEVRDCLVKLMKGVVEKQLRSVLTVDDYIGFKSYRCQILMRQTKGLYQPLKKLENFARALGHLLEGSFATCKAILEADSPKGPKKSDTTNPFMKPLDLLEHMCANPQLVHPKQDKVKSICLEHFTSSSPSSESGRMIIFATFRDYVEEIVKHLNQEHPIIRAAAFVGQSSSKKGQKGLTQKEQLAVLDGFKGGHYNVLVATSVGEEGLDIGEVDSIVFYDCSKDSIRTIQRAGRTGRKKAGCVHVLMAEAREENNWQRAVDAYHDVQNDVLQGKVLELYADVHRLLPDDLRPHPLEFTPDVQPFVNEEPSKSRRRLDKPSGTKRKRESDPLRNVPDGASTGFIKAKDLLRPCQKTAKFQEYDLFKSFSDSEDDKLLMNGLKFKKNKEAVTVPKSNAKPVGKMASNDSDISDHSQSSSGTSPAAPPMKKLRTNKLLLSSPTPINQSFPNTRLQTPVNCESLSASLAQDSLYEKTPLMTQPVCMVRRRAPITIPSSPNDNKLRRLRRLGQVSRTELLTEEERQVARAVLIDDEVLVSGEEETSGSEETDEGDEETEEDRRFLESLPETQIPHDYAQTQVYHQSLFTQPAIQGNQLNFRDRPARNPKFVRTESSRRRPGISSSPQACISEQYEDDGFIVPDDDSL